VPSDAVSDTGNDTGRADASAGAGVGTPPAPARTGRPLLATAIVLGVVALDQLSKWWAVEQLPNDPVRLIGSDVGFVLVRNTGSAFSLFQAFTPLLAVVAIVVAVILVRTVRRTRDTLMIVGLSLVLGGALGNLMDRLFRTPGFLRGAVVDFVHVGEFPTFNVADSAITIGAILIVIWAIRADMRERREERADPGARADG
jgi:signal peptidase II